MQKDIYGEVLNAVIQVTFCFPSHAPVVQHMAREGTFFLIHTKAIYVLAVALGYLLSPIFPYISNATI